MKNTKSSLSHGRLDSQRGFSIVSAIFLLVVLAFLGSAMVTFSTNQQMSSAMDVVGARAYQAARAGMEWGAYQVLPGAGGAFAVACSPGPTSSVVAPLPNTLAGFAVNVECRSASQVEAATAITVYQITSTATRGAAGSPDYVERQMTVTIAK